MGLPATPKGGGWSLPRPPRPSWWGDHLPRPPIQPWAHLFVPHPQRWNSPQLWMAPGRPLPTPTVQRTTQSTPLHDRMEVCDPSLMEYNCHLKRAEQNAWESYICYKWLPEVGVYLGTQGTGQMGVTSHHGKFFSGARIILFPAGSRIANGTFPPLPRGPPPRRLANAFLAAPSGNPSQWTL